MVERVKNLQEVCYFLFSQRKSEILHQSLELLFTDYAIRVMVYLSVKSGEDS
jgi:hypothetical protein